MYKVLRETNTVLWVLFSLCDNRCAHVNPAGDPHATRVWRCWQTRALLRAWAARTHAGPTSEGRLSGCVFPSCRVAVHTPAGRAPGKGAVGRRRPCPPGGRWPSRGSLSSHTRGVAREEKLILRIVICRYKGRFNRAAGCWLGFHYVFQRINDKTVFHGAEDRSDEIFPGDYSMSFPGGGGRAGLCDWCLGTASLQRGQGSAGSPQTFLRL